MNNLRLKEDTPLRIIITLPYLFSIRDFLFTPVWEEMAKRKDVHFFLLCHDMQIGQLISERESPNITFINFPPSNTDHNTRIKKFLRWDLGTQVWIKLFQLLNFKYIKDSLIYRFAVLNNLSHYRIRKKKSSKEQKRQQILYDYHRGEAAGFPFPKSKAIFKLLYGLHHSFYNLIRKEDIAFIKDLNPDLFVFGRLHLHTTAYWARALRQFGIPMIGIVSSWDHPTTKGSTPRGMSGYVVASKHMAEEMSTLHGLKKNKICQIGKVQMDVYKNPTIFSSRNAILESLNIPHDHRLITFGTNTTGLKEHEVSIARRLSKDFINGHYGKATLLLRTHPQDINWKKDFLSLSRPPWVICLNACSFDNQVGDSMLHGRDDQVMLANLMKHSDVVIQSRGSLALDAIAFDTPVISLAFDGDLVKMSNDSFLMEYGFEHYKPLVAAQGTWIVGSYKALDQAIQEYLRDPAIHSKGRKIICSEHIKPLDGKGSQRLVDYLVECSIKAREGTLPEGDWDLTGLGDTTWSSRQTCNIQDYVRK